MHKRPELLAPAFLLSNNQGVLRLIELTQFVIPVKTGIQHLALKFIHHPRKMLGPRLREDNNKWDFAPNYKRRYLVPAHLRNVRMRRSGTYLFIQYHFCPHRNHGVELLDLIIDQTGTAV